MNILLNWIQPNSNFWVDFLIEFSRKRGYSIIFWIEYFSKNDIEWYLNWILSWNEWMNRIFNRYFHFLIKKTLFFSIWTLFGQFLGTFLIRPVSMIPRLLNWTIFWIESLEFIFNWILVWIEFCVKQSQCGSTRYCHMGEQYWIEYWIESFFGKIQILNWIREGIAHP